MSITKVICRVACFLLISVTVVAAGPAPHDRAWKAIKKGDADELLNVIRKHPTVATTPNAHGSPLLHLAASSGCVDCIEVLLKNGSDINSRDKYGKTALHHAARNATLEMLEFLVSSGADVNAESSNGQTPLYWAKGRGIMLGDPKREAEQRMEQDQIVKFLKKHGADDN